MYLVVPDLGSPQATETLAAFARQAAAAGARRAVLLSMPEGGGPDYEQVLAAEQTLEHAGLERTVLTPGRASGTPDLPAAFSTIGHLVRAASVLHDEPETGLAGMAPCTWFLLC